MKSSRERSRRIRKLAHDFFRGELTLKELNREVCEVASPQKELNYEMQVQRAHNQTGPPDSVREV